MNVLLTGASGFLGSRILKKLAKNQVVTTLGRQPIGDRHICCDLAHQTPDLAGQSFDFVVHSAGKAHSIPRNAQERHAYNQVNVQGTTSLLTALERRPVLPKSIVHISTVLVYGRLDGQLLDENTPLLATDAYGLSKIRAEKIVQTWGEKTGVRTTILRLSLVIAEQPMGNLAAMINAIRRGYYVRIGDALARRSMVWADDVAAVIERAAEVSGIFNLTDGHHPSVRELENAIAHRVGRNRIPAIPLRVAKAIARIGDGVNAIVGRRFPLDSIALQKLTTSLTFSDEAARQHLNWQPHSILETFQ